MQSNIYQYQPIINFRFPWQCTHLFGCFCVLIHKKKKQSLSQNLPRMSTVWNICYTVQCSVIVCDFKNLQAKYSGHQYINLSERHIVTDSLTVQIRLWLTVLKSCHFDFLHCLIASQFKGTYQGLLNIYILMDIKRRHCMFQLSFLSQHRRFSRHQLPNTANQSLAIDKGQEKCNFRMYICNCKITFCKICKITKKITYLLPVIFGHAVNFLFIKSPAKLNITNLDELTLSCIPESCTGLDTCGYPQVTCKKKIILMAGTGRNGFNAGGQFTVLTASSGLVLVPGFVSMVRMQVCKMDLCNTPP